MASHDREATVRSNFASWTTRKGFVGLSRMLTVAVLLGLVAGTAHAAEANEQDGRAYAVDQLFLDFAEDLPVHPPAKSLMKLSVTLGVVDDGYVSPREGLQTVETQLADIPKLGRDRMYESAIRAISNTIVDHFRDWGYAGVVVAPHPSDIAPDSGADQRLEGQTALRLVVRSMTGRGRPLKVGAIWETADKGDGRTYEISQFILKASDAVEGQVNLQKLRETPIVLADGEDGYFGTRAGAKQVQVRLVDVPKLEEETFYETALYDVCKALTEQVRAMGHEGVYVWPSDKDLTEGGEDKRFANQTAMRLVVQQGDLPEDPRQEPQVVEAEPEDAADEEAMVIAPEDMAEPTDADGRRYPIDQIVVEYDEDHPDLPDLTQIMDTPIRLTRVPDGYVAPKPDAPEASRTIRLNELPTLPEDHLYGSAVRYINQRLVQAFNNAGLIGIFVAPHPEEINNQGQDLRPESQSALRILVQTGTVSDVRTVASGERFPVEDRVNHPKHTEIRDDSPVQPSDEAEPGESTDLLRKDMLDRYVYFLNRHPGRRVDVSVAPGETPGTTTLDLLVTESKPWIVYAQGSNTGTEQTSEWRERFGFVHNQLTNNDDILSLDYITANFQDSHTFLASYEAPLFDADRLRWRVEGLYSEFTASDVGFADEDFIGDSWYVGGELIWNFWQQDQSFLDLVVGARWENVKVENEVIDVTGESDFFLPTVGLRYERFTQTASSIAEVEYEVNVPGIADTEEEDLTNLGRLNPDDDSKRLIWNLSQTFYLEPLLWPNDWKNPETWRTSTLAHEFALNFRGQYAFGSRLNPQRQRTIGGLYSVRGYEESVVAGDTALIFTAEYRFHLPRALAPSQDPGTLFGDTFKWRPQYVFGRPDWNLMFRGFFDVGTNFHSDEVPAFENNEVLVGTGVGAELTLKRNFSLRIDWGVALNNVEDATETGDNRFHFVGTLLY